LFLFLFSLSFAVLKPVSTEGKTRDDVPKLADEVWELMSNELQHLSNES